MFLSCTESLMVMKNHFILVNYHFEHANVFKLAEGSSGEEKMKAYVLA